MADEPHLFISIYTDEDITSLLAPALREKGFHAQSTVEAGMLKALDEAQLAYASDHGMTILTYNTVHFTQLANLYAATGQSHAGIILASEQHGRKHFGQLLRQVLHLLNVLSVDDMRDCVIYLR